MESMSASASTIIVINAVWFCDGAEVGASPKAYASHTDACATPAVGPKIGLVPFGDDGDTTGEVTDTEGAATTGDVTATAGARTGETTGDVTATAGAPTGETTGELIEAEGAVTAGSSSSSSSQKGRPSAETLGGAFFGAGPFFDWPAFPPELDTATTIVVLVLLVTVVVVVLVVFELEAEVVVPFVAAEALVPVLNHLVVLVLLVILVLLEATVPDELVLLVFVTTFAFVLFVPVVFVPVTTDPVLLLAKELEPLLSPPFPLPLPLPFPPPLFPITPALPFSFFLAFFGLIHLVVIFAVVFTDEASLHFSMKNTSKRKRS
jgi:hypothetical protein